MRLAIISDIHGNLEALIRTFELIDQQGITETVCLGDVVGYGANPNECMKIVRERCRIILLGNHDAAAVDLSVARQFTELARTSACWTNNVLEPEHKQFIKHLPISEVREDIRFVHASPYDPDEWNYILSYFDARQAFRCFPERICFVGHSHVPVIYSEEGEVGRVRSEGRYVVNVGSVGQPRDRNPHLSFGIFNTEGWIYHNVRAEYDRVTAAEKIRAAGLPRMLADRLVLGI